MITLTMSAEMAGVHAEALEFSSRQTMRQLAEARGISQEKQTFLDVLDFAIESLTKTREALRELGDARKAAAADIQLSAPAARVNGDARHAD